jgi:hypothetical protein
MIMSSVVGNNNPIHSIKGEIMITSSVVCRKNV